MVILDNTSNKKADNSSVNTVETIYDVTLCVLSVSSSVGRAGMPDIGSGDMRGVASSIAECEIGLVLVVWGDFFFSSRRRHTRFDCDWSSDVCFFFSSRRRHTRFDCDWSSDVCSSDRSEEHTSELQSQSNLKQKTAYEI